MSTRVRWALAALCSLTSIVAFGASPALAAPPETPETKAASAITGTTAKLNGVLNPKAKVAASLEYDFINRQSALECAEGIAVPEPPVKASGKPKEAVSVNLTALEPSKPYTFCIVAKHEAESSSGLPVTFETLGIPPKIDSESTSAVNSTKATLEAQVNPNNQATTFKFEYSTKATGETLEGTITTVEGEGPLPEAFADQLASVTTGAVLAPGTTYFYRVVAKNGTPPPAKGAVTSLTTVPTPNTDAPSPIAATTATLRGHLTLNPVDTKYSFSYKASATECTGGGATATTPADAGKGTGNAPQATAVTGLLPHTQYTVCFVTSNTFGSEQGPPVTFTTPAAQPAIEGESVTNVSSDSATLDAQINPHGAETTYHFQYGTSESYGQSTAESPSLGSDNSGHSAEAHIQSLSAGTVYHYRVVATNSQSPAGGTPGADQVFTTQTAGEFVLPDGRQWEMVTPPQKQGAQFEPITIASPFEPIEGAVRASAAGNAIADVASAPSEAEPQGNANKLDSVLSTRSASGWSSQVIAPPHPQGGPAVPPGGEYLSFSDDLSRGIAQPLGDFSPLSPDATESTPYLRTDYLNGNVSEHCEASYKTAASCFQPLVTAADDTATPFNPFGEANANGECAAIATPICGPLFVAGTPDLRHVVVSSPVQLTSTPIGIATEAKPKPNLYEFSSGRLQLLSIMPGAEVGARSFVLAGSRTGSTASEEDVAARHAISDDGNRVVLEELNEEPRRLGIYLRDIARGETVRLDVPQGAGTEPSVNPEYMTASSDASRVFFLDSARLTTQSSAGGVDLYEYDLNAPMGSRLTDLTVDQNAGEAANVRTVLGSSADGSYMYFAAAGKLAPGAVSDGECTIGAAGEVGTGCNVYVRREGVTRFIAGLSQEDRSDWETVFNLSRQSVRVSSHGGWLAFISNRSLTGYDTRDAVSGRPDQEVYLYDAASNSLRCASCNPTGARPVGSAIVPGWTKVLQELALYQPRYLSDSGRVFFDAHDSLVPKDVNGNWDVYQYEPEGVPAGEHTCLSTSGSGSDVYKPAHGFEVEGRKGEEPAGCVALISSGTSSEESTFLDASETGGDVFFLTTAKLSAQDFDTAPDVYDAHECTSASPCLPAPAAQPPPCDTEASCRAAPTPQPDIFGTPASGTFSGPGNIIPPPPTTTPKPLTSAQKLAKALKACRAKHNKHGRAVCESQARKRYGFSKAKKATSKRTAKR